MTNEEISTTAVEYIKTNKKLVIDTFANLEKYPSVENPVTIIMAGSPGAGKTEFSQKLQEILNNDDPEHKYVRIDADDIRELIPGYAGTNSHLYQKAATKGIEFLIEHGFKHSLNMIIDGTFAHYEPSRRNVERSIKRNRKTRVYYIYQDPKIAWDYTKKREAIEKRRINKDTFINAYYASYENIQKIKKEFKDHILVNLIIKDEYDHAVSHFNIDQIDNLVKIAYNKEDLEKLLV